MTRLFFLLAFASVASAGQIVTLPSTAAGNGQAYTATDTLLCVTVPAPFTKTYTKLAGYIDVGAAASTSGFAIYTDSDSTTTQLGEVTGASTTNNTVMSATGLSIALTAGTRYRLCTCSTSTAVQYLGVYANSTGAAQLMGLLNANDFPTTIGTGATPCISGNPPTDTGALTAATNFRLPLMTLEE